MMVATEGDPGSVSQTGLKDTLKAQNYFLTCSCVPENDLSLALLDDTVAHIATTVQAIDWLNPDVVSLRLARPEGYDYIPGQFLNLHNADDVARSYSLASVPGQDTGLALHIRHVPGGKVSGWVADQLRPGDSVKISTAAGHCFYVSDRPEQPLLLIGTGTGLAPLYGILRDALQQSHIGPIHLYHGSSSAEGLYLLEILRTLERDYGQVHYHPCVSRGEVPEGVQTGRATDLALSEQGSLTGWRVFVCGREDMVKATQQKAFLAGASLQDILADPFIEAVDDPGLGAE
jgi:ferredoxin-NADP reductase